MPATPPQPQSDQRRQSGQSGEDALILPIAEEASDRSPDCPPLPAKTRHAAVEADVDAGAGGDGRLRRGDAAADRQRQQLRASVEPQAAQLIVMFGAGDPDDALPGRPINCLHFERPLALAHGPSRPHRRA